MEDLAKVVDKDFKKESIFFIFIKLASYLGIILSSSLL